MIAHRISYGETKRMSSLVVDHLSGKKELDELRVWTPDLDGCRAAAAQRSLDPTNRRILCEVVEGQYAGLELGDAVAENMKCLRSDRSLTVTTGHQLCILTGPLYVPFKILNVIRLARQLSQDLDRPVVPIFWMASEDHDRPEIDHAWLGGTRVHWEGSDSGPVGRMKLTGIGPMLKEVEEILGDGPEALKLRDLLHESYRPDRTLADATRRLIHGLFGRFGVLCLDGDDPRLKSLFAEVMREEMINQVTLRSVTYADEKLKSSYPIQAHAREINLFHMRPGHRSRIVLDGERYQVLDGPSFTMDEVIKELAGHPENFSPNVLLRPLYQEVLLPNVAYIGGGGELAYWLQLKWAFQAFRVPMPVTILRTGAAFISVKHMGQWKSMRATVADIFEDTEQLISRMAEAHSSFPTDVEREKGLLEGIYTGLLKRVTAVDASLKGAVEAKRVRAMKGMDRIGRGLVRSAKREQQVLMDRIERIQAAVLPDGKLQERKENILPLIAARGVGLLDELLDILDPLDPRFTLIEE